MQIKEPLINAREYRPEIASNTSEGLMGFELIHKNKRPSLNTRSSSKRVIWRELCNLAVSNSNRDFSLALYLSVISNRSRAIIRHDWLYYWRWLSQWLIRKN